MHIDTFLNRLEKTRKIQNGFVFELGQTLRCADFIAVENKLRITIPQRIKEFYSVANGIKTSNPYFKLIELSSWTIDDGFIHFATFDLTNKIYFDINQLNQAGEWTIINRDINYEITLTISSFWSNKIWHWIEQRKKMWVDNWLTTD
jgi:hypothetical protein